MAGHILPQCLLCLGNAFCLMAVEAYHLGFAYCNVIAQTCA